MDYFAPHPILYQLRHPWHWLTYGQNATAIAAMASGVIGAVTVAVLARTLIAVNKQATAADRQAKAAEEQAKVARKQTEVAEQQRIASEESVKAARLQSALTRHQLLSQLRPFLALKKELSTVGHGERWVIQNHGQGVALDISATLRKPPLDTIQVSQAILGPDQVAEISGNLLVLPQRGIQIQYRSQDNRYFTTYAEPWVNNPAGLQQIPMERTEKGGWLADPTVPNT
jgi:hypothetical protein